MLIEEVLKVNKATSIGPKDTFMLMALWMELYPGPTPKTLKSIRPTGAVITDQLDRIVQLASTGESHAIVRAILMSPIDPQGCDVYVSRFPCSMCAKMMVQAGIRKIFYFPAKDIEVDWADYCRLQDAAGNLSPQRRNSGGNATLSQRIIEKIESNMHSVKRLVQNNPIAMTVCIPIWFERMKSGPPPLENLESYWQLDDGINHRYQYILNYENIIDQFRWTCLAMSLLKQRYDKDPRLLKGDAILSRVDVYKHAIILAHIASKQTNDQKIGVGAVLVNPDLTYGAIGWNGFPKQGGLSKLKKGFLIIHKQEQTMFTRAN